LKRGKKKKKILNLPLICAGGLTYILNSIIIEKQIFFFFLTKKKEKKKKKKKFTFGPCS